MRELERTGAFERPVLALLGTTGTGWVDELNVRSIEYLTDGNCATAAMQYSFLPSPVAFVTDRDLPERGPRPGERGGAGPRRSSGGDPAEALSRW